ncbi:HutD family protein [Acetobacter senegalensis]|uniref:HutD family protein n=1 Tax=Acetobacter senegalensis TaxID=446692 RepID=UPI0007772B2B|nr:HutD family protein [Acetobacter senegalensis]
MWQKRVLADIPSVPWRNGHGYTKVIAEGGTEAGFQWRLSVADILKDSSFSIFTGWRRFFALLGQGSLTLSEENGNWSHTVNGSGRPFQFSGEDSVQSSDVHVSVQALNLMVRANVIWNQPVGILLKEAAFIIEETGEAQIFLIPSIGTWSLHEGRSKVRIVPGEIWSSSAQMFSQTLLTQETPESSLFFVKI